MTLPQFLYVCRLQVRDTLRQSLANGVFWVLLGPCLIVLLFCLGISMQDGESLRAPDDIALDKPHGFVKLAFGAWKLPLFRDGQAMVHFILLILGEVVFGVLGTVLALIVTAGFIPEFLQPANATVLLSKPTPRWALLLGRYLGVLCLLAAYAGFYVIGTWLVVGLRTGFWVNSYLWGLPLLLLQVATVYSFSAFLGVCTRSNLVCVFGTILFWLICWGINYGRHLMIGLRGELPQQGPVLKVMTEVVYWMLPKPVDVGMILHVAVDAGQNDPRLQAVVQVGAFDPELSLVSSVVFIAAMILLAATQLSNKEY